MGEGGREGRPASHAQWSHRCSWLLPGCKCCLGLGSPFQTPPPHALEYLLLRILSHPGHGIFRGCSNVKRQVDLLCLLKTFHLHTQRSCEAASVSHGVDLDVVFTNISVCPGGA